MNFHLALAGNARHTPVPLYGGACDACVFRRSADAGSGRLPGGTDVRRVGPRIHNQCRVGAAVHPPPRSHGRDRSPPVAESPRAVPLSSRGRVAIRRGREPEPHARSVADPARTRVRPVHALARVAGVEDLVQKKRSSRPNNSGPTSPRNATISTSGRSACPTRTVSSSSTKRG